MTARADFPKDATGRYFKSQHDRVVLKESALIKLVNEYIQRYRTRNHKPNIAAVRAKLGWSPQQWEQYKAKYGNAIIFDSAPEFSVLANDDTDDTKALGVSLQARGINPEEIEQRIKVTYGALRAELRAIGLTNEEVCGAIAMQNFGEHRFANAMEMISAGVFGMAIKLQTRQKEIEERLEGVRQALVLFGTIVSPDRDAWVKEEDLLLKQYTTIGKLLAEIQRTWYEGSAQLALVRMRIRQDQGLAKTTGPRQGKRGFSPRVMEQASDSQPGKAPAAEPEVAASSDGPIIDLTPSWP